MLLDILYLLIGLILLWTPRSWLRLGKPQTTRKALPKSGGPVRDRMPGDHSLWAEEEFKRRRNWLDFGRAITGALAVGAGLSPVITNLVGVPEVSLTQVTFLTQAVILLAAVIIQMLRVEERLTLFPPVFFVLGLAFVLVGWKAAAIGFIVIWSINIVLPNPGVFLTVYGGGVVVLAVFFGEEVRPALLMGGLAVTPPLLAVLFRRRLAQFRKRTKIVVR
jgi:hypothetical protein